MNQKNLTISCFFLIILPLLAGCKTQSEFQNRADLTLRAIYHHYATKENHLLRETYPFNEEYTASYLSDEEQAKRKNPYSYLWPYSGTLSAATALYEISKEKKYADILQKKVFPGLEEYFDTQRTPSAYASYINSAPQSDRFYDDNIWIGLDFTDLYLLTKDKHYLEKAKSIWKFIESGTDSKLGGGVYWCEQKKRSKNTCSNAPGAVYALKLFEATADSSYFHQGEKLYHWTKENLQDTDFLYLDNINLSGKITKWKFPYNSGQMLQAACLLYKLTGKESYLNDARNIAQSAYSYFFRDFTATTGKTFKTLKNEDPWFIAIMLRGYIELYNIDKNNLYINAFRENLNFAWEYMREDNGLFNKDWTGKTKDDSKWLLTQAALSEMYARLAVLK